VTVNEITKITAKAHLIDLNLQSNSIFGQYDIDVGNVIIPQKRFSPHPLALCKPTV
jgi:hypothetical protein